MASRRVRGVVSCEDIHVPERIMNEVRHSRWKCAKTKDASGESPRPLKTNGAPAVAYTDLLCLISIPSPQYSRNAHRKHILPKRMHTSLRHTLGILRLASCGKQRGRITNPRRLQTWSSSADDSGFPALALGSDHDPRPLSTQTKMTFLWSRGRRT